MAVHPEHIEILAYSNVPSRVIFGSIMVRLTIGEYEAKIKVYIVANHQQSKDILIGHDVLNHADLTTTTRAGRWLFFPSKQEDEVIETTKSHLPLCATETVQIPPKTMRLFKITKKGESTKKKAIYIDSANQCDGLFILQCVTWTDRYLLVISTTEDMKEVSRKTVLVCRVRANFSRAEIEPSQKKHRVFTTEDIRELVGADVDAIGMADLLAMINEFRDCFAVEFRELGESKTGRMVINLETPELVTY